MSEIRRETGSTFAEEYNRLKEVYLKFEVGSPEFMALYDYGARENLKVERDKAQGVVGWEDDRRFYQLRYSQTLERIHQRTSQIPGYAQALKEISSNVHELSKLHPDYEDSPHPEALVLLDDVKSAILFPQHSESASSSPANT